MYGIGVGGMLPMILSRTSAALSAQALQGTSVEKHPNRILVVIELSGGNDGLNTVVPFGDVLEQAKCRRDRAHLLWLCGGRDAFTTVKMDLRKRWPTTSRDAACRTR